MELLKKATFIDGVAATEDRDSQGEILKLAGADISQMTTRGFWNDNHGTGFLNTLGRITEAKKIFKESDCSNDRHRHFWEMKKRPLLYVAGYLFDTEGDHPNAKAVSAVMQEFRRQGTPLDVQMSVEGKVLDRAHYDRSILAQSMVRNVALTLVPANKESCAEIAEKINKSMPFFKSEAGQAVSSCIERVADSIAKGVQSCNKWDEPTDVERSEALLKRIIELTKMMKAENAKRLWKKHSDDFHVSEDGKYIISRYRHRQGTEGQRHYLYRFEVTHYPEGQANTKNYLDLGHKPSLKAAKDHVESHASGKLTKMMSPGYGGSGAPGQLAGGAALVAKEQKRKALKEIIKTVLGSNPGVPLSKALELVLDRFRERYG